MANLIFNNIFINDEKLIIGPKEAEGKIKNNSLVINDYYFNEKTFEKAEVKMQKKVIEKLLEHNNLKQEDILAMVGGDLINQLSISSSTALSYNIPYLGVYSACATFVESLIVASLLLQSMPNKKVICYTSSHSHTAERQFRFPVEYGNTKPLYSTCTSTGAVSALVSTKKSKYQITKATIGKVIDLGVKDVANMGAVMAPAAANTINDHLTFFNEKVSDYDVILTGDLGKIGMRILKDYYSENFKVKLNNLVDAGSEIYYDKQKMFSGGSGPFCLPFVFFEKILKIRNYKKILLVGTGSLHSPVLVNQKNSLPAIAHAVTIEVIS